MVEPETEATLRQEWRTPPDFIAVLRREFVIDIDVAASQVNAIVPIHWDAESNGLLKPWFARPSITAWCNPGFKDQGSWLDKAIAEVETKPQSTALLMALAAPSTAWWRRAIEAGAEIRLLSPRVQFVAPPGIKQSSNARDNALLVIRSQPQGRPRPAHIWTWRWKGEESDRT